MGLIPFNSFSASLAGGRLFNSGFGVLGLVLWVLAMAETPSIVRVSVVELGMGSFLHWVVLYPA
ncbi:MAG: hypothetical protein ACKO5C_07535 [Ferruginibacter sp.]